MKQKNRLIKLLPVLFSYLKSGGLGKFRRDIRVLWNFLSDVSHGRYKGYRGMSLVLTIVALFYLLLPFDIVPDLLPFGLVDDMTILIWILRRLTDDLRKYKEWQRTIEKD